MSYSSFTLAQLIKYFGLSFHESAGLLGNVAEAESSDLLKSVLSENVALAVAIGTEKARSEMIITPILLELRRHFAKQISLFSGIDFTVAPEKGLSGVCDYLVSQSAEQLLVRAPVIMLVEAKNENLKGGLPQCIAEMVAAQQFNQQQENPVDAVYGVVTSGTVWRFLRLRGSVVEIDLDEYYTQNIGQVLGILCSAITG
ncbi:MAG: hypothetical protein AAF716_23095 [Cyanobacteria bacterium P01_D01_bin.1]